VAQIFNRIDVYPLYLGGTQIVWSVHPLFRAPTPWTFYVQWARDDKDWSPVDKLTTSNRNGTFQITDPKRHLWSTADRSNYRVLLQDAAGQYHASQSEGVFGRLVRREWLLAREVLRKENLWLRQPGVGNCGLLFRRRDWGDRCDFAGCLDPDTLEATNVQCPICYGTGYKQGYYTPVDYGVGPLQIGPRKLKNEQPTSQSESVSRMVRSTNCPLPRTGDFWLQTGSDKRWYIDTVETKTEMNGYPLILFLTMRQAEPTDVVYLLDASHTG
jgi:hypothetical protein